MDLTIVFYYVTGLLLAYAYDYLSYNKPASQSHTFIGTTYAAGNAVDRNSKTCMRTRPIGLSSPDKTLWWKVDLGGVYNIYSINLLFKNYDGSRDYRQRGRFAGFSLYVSTTGDIQGSALCYKDRPQLPPLNFTITCSEYGRYVIFYNERLDEVSYPVGYELTNVFTELCEVIVQGCNRPGMYGSNCDILCPINCKYNTCHIQLGTCFACNAGWTGTSCDKKCKEGWYGENCRHQCVEHCRYNSTCNHVTGQCEKGCTAGWTGFLCDIVCDDGTYGHDCINNCSGHCMNGSQCNKQSGHCDMGCNPGYLNSDCSRECEPRYYGTNCSMACSTNCKTCRHTDGLCSCKAGWRGHDCITECSHSYGENCQYPCSEHCINHQCDRFTGKCLCDCKHGTDSILSSRKENATDCIFWIVAFSLSLATTVIFISTTFFLQRKLSLQQKSAAGDVNLYLRCGSNTEQIAITNEASHYQDLRVSQNENTYQTIDQQ